MEKRGENIWRTHPEINKAIVILRMEAVDRERNCIIRSVPRIPLSLQFPFLLRRCNIFLRQIKTESLPFIKEHHQIILQVAGKPGTNLQAFCSWPVSVVEYSHSPTRRKIVFLVLASVSTANLYLLSYSWDESSSISSGLSDASDNLSSEEFNASSSLNSLPTTPTASRRNSTIVVREFTDASG